MSLESVGTQRGFLCNSCSYGKSSHKLYSGIFDQSGPSSRIVAAHLGLGTNILTRKHGGKKYFHSNFIKQLLCYICVFWICAVALHFWMGMSSDTAHNHTQIGQGNVWTPHGSSHLFCLGGKTCSTSYTHILAWSQTPRS